MALSFGVPDYSCACWADPAGATLDAVESIRDATLARCGACRQFGWHRAGERRRPVDTQELAAVRAWGEGPYPLGAHAKVLAAIRDVDGVTPCRIRWNDGSVSDPALVIVPRRGALYPESPSDHPGGPPRMFRGVAAVEPTSYALPFEIRVDTPRERHSVSVVAPDGRAAVIGGEAWPIHVGTLGCHRGAELREGGSSWWRSLLQSSLPGFDPYPRGFTVVWADAGG